MVFRAQALLEMGNAALGLQVRPLGRAIRPLQGGGPVLQQLFQPPIEHGGLERGLVADRRDGVLVDQVASEQRHLLRCRVVRPLAFHGGVLRAQFYGEDTPVPAEASQMARPLLYEVA